MDRPALVARRARGCNPWSMTGNLNLVRRRRHPANISPLVDALTLSTPEGECTWLDTGPVNGVTVKTLNAGHYSQAPVRGPDGGYLGIITTQRADELLKGNQPLTANDPKLDSKHIEAQLDVLAMINALGDPDRPAVAVLEGSTFMGLLTVSDLNRHAMRAALFGIVGVLEANLAWWVEPRLPQNAASFIPDVRPADRRLRRALLRDWSGRIGVVSSLYFADFLVLLEHVPILRDGLDPASLCKALDAATRLNNLRTRVMHPPKAVVDSSPDSPLRLEDDVRLAIELNACLVRAGGA